MISGRLLFCSVVHWMVFFCHLRLYASVKYLLVSLTSRFLVTCTPNHWSNEEEMKEYIELTILPYINKTYKEFDLAEDHPALAIFDAFRGLCA